MLERCSANLDQPILTGITRESMIKATLSLSTQIILLIILRWRRLRLRKRSYNPSFFSRELSSHLLPIHILFLRLCVFIFIVQAITLLIPGMGAPVPDSMPENTILGICGAKGIIWGLQHLLLDGIGVLLVQPGIGRRAIRRSFIITTPWAIITVLAVGMSCKAQGDSHGTSGTIILMVYYFVEMILFIIVGFIPCWRRPRPAIRMWAAVWILLRILAEIALFVQIYHPEVGSCLNFVLVHLTFVSLLPMAIFLAFRADTKHWYGVAWDLDEQVLKAGMVNDLRSPLIGLSLPNDSIRDIGRGIEKLRRQDMVSFAELSIDAMSLLGSGGTAKVFKGKFHKQDAAFKLLYSMEITSKTIRAFFSEAAILQSLSTHPNIIHLIGVCIAPPALCQILELCDGNMHTLIKDRRKWVELLSNPIGSSQQILLSATVDDFFLSLATQCTRAVEFLHSRKPPIIHRDIKSLNFLYCKPPHRGIIIKLADMDLAGSNVLRTGEGRTIEWAAPEILLEDQGASSTKSDIFSLLVVWWELLTLQEPYGDMDEDEVLNRVKSGICLPIPEGTPKTLQGVFESGWSWHPRVRPSADALIEVLWGLWDDPQKQAQEKLRSLSLFLFDPQRYFVRCKPKMPPTATGSKLVEFMKENRGRGVHPLLTSNTRCVQANTIIQGQERDVKMCQRMLDLGFIRNVNGKTSTFNETKLYELVGA